MFFCPLIKKKKKKIVPSLLTFPIWRFCRFLIRWRFSGCRFGVTGRTTTIADDMRAGTFRGVWRAFEVSVVQSYCKTI